MAKANKKVTVQVNAVAAPEQAKGPDHWQTREDVSDLMRPNALREDKARHGRALDAMRKTLAHEEGRMKEKSKGPQIKTRLGRKVSVRNIGRR
jgi:hypothetical protein